MEATAKVIIGTYQNDPLFRQALGFFQKGEWEQGLEALNTLEGKYPLENELRHLRQEMQLRARIDEDERQDLAQGRRQRATSLVVRLGLLAAILLVALAGYRQYSAWLGRQLAEARQVAEREMQRVELAAKYRDAQVMARAGRTDAALILLDEISKIDPEYPGLNETRVEALSLQDIETRYQEAKELHEAGDREAALAILKEIPDHRGAQLLIDEIENESLLSDLLAQADGAYEAEEWESAVSGYETVQALNAGFLAGYVEERLFESCLNAAQDRLAKEPDSLVALEAASDYFNCASEVRPLDERVKSEEAEARQMVEARLVKSYVEAAQTALAGEGGDSLSALDTANDYLVKALRIFPNDEDLKTQSAMALAYMQSQDNFSKGRWVDVVGDLEFVYNEDPNYALGTARQTLYEAYLALGNLEEAAGGYEAALTYYQKAAGLAQQDSSSPLRLYEIQIRTARVFGALGKYEDAVPLYRAAIEAAGLPAQAETNPQLEAKLEQAERYSTGANFRTAFRFFREIVETYPPVTEQETVTVQSGEYLTQLANRYGTTVGAILEANPTVNPKSLKPGDQILVPVLSSNP